MAKKLELLVLSGLLGAPCATILAKCAAAPSLFAVHPAANAVAFLLCFPCETVDHACIQVWLQHGRS